MWRDSVYVVSKELIYSASYFIINVIFFTFQVLEKKVASYLSGLS